MTSSVSGIQHSVYDDENYERKCHLVDNANKYYKPLDFNFLDEDVIKDVLVVEENERRSDWWTYVF